ncbi:queuine tRNA-ribosyltransferase, putative [Ichthyophthirius multifiliis]|uniref:Queuine tRNA-ribosyltransferase catalytic subunit 1 n=1 Tax=Ichthyophthirius multifiliis TaxID=5932 RepID=G0QY07_ICHMU|nr:queuine tRNA-ribosyltransferase, putative [Ichthyophthirius multifiliis]EGR29898.1 queuine tRNA-ribosyltransferase, putative [Ichthyophthirius multifiliis]|eukprot:XP_004031134.1 queuine tRNA-ribosyltransferase, putative [Ichthyophthirius multifiliis]
MQNFFKVQKSYKKARLSTLNLRHGEVQTPVFMPVGTKGTIKGLTSQEIENLDYKLILANTYHLAFQPGASQIEKYKGIHNFMNYSFNILTDSGGYQMVSLEKLCQITEQGANFQSHTLPSETIILTPEKSIYIQNQINSDIMMVLDDVVSPVNTTEDRIKEACERTIRWVDRNIQEKKLRNSNQAMYAIIQGGIDKNLRLQCIQQLKDKDVQGFAIGGLSGGENKEKFWETVDFCTDHLPKDKPVYLMGVGYPEDLIVCAALGVDQFDCVFPTRTARYGMAFSRFGPLKIKNKEFKYDFRPIDQNCLCQACQQYTRAYLNQISKQEVFCSLLSQHNLFFLQKLMNQIRKAIDEQKLEEFMQLFLINYFQNGQKIPNWIKNALGKYKLINL